MSEQHKYGAALAKHQVIDGHPYAVVPFGWRLQSLRRLMPHPPRIKQKVVFRDIEDYLKYVEKFKSSKTLTFIGWFSAKTIFDYHHLTDGGIPTAGNCDHVAIYRSLTLNWHDERLETLNPYKTR